MDGTSKLLRYGQRRLRRLWELANGFDRAGDGRVPRSLVVCGRDGCSVCSRAGDRSSGPRLIYLLPTGNVPTGGNKVTYRHVELIAAAGVPCFAFHAEKPGTGYTWFDHSVPMLPAGHFDPRRDFLVFPEIWASLAARFCVPAGIRYAIFVQNGYMAHFAAGFPRDVITEAYRKADLLFSISEDTTRMISLIYPFVDERRIMRLYYSVPPMFTPSAKEKLITYMPRKLRAHSERMAVYLQNILRDGWRLQPIHGLPEQGVAALMSRSSIFLSFSELEGYPIPPLEAALAGNIVVGYTGEGAKEYFRRPIFREVGSGDFHSFIREVKQAMEDVESGALERADLRDHRSLLAAGHSAQNEQEYLRRAVSAMSGIVQGGETAVA